MCVSVCGVLGKGNSTAAMAATVMRPHCVFARECSNLHCSVHTCNKDTQTQ